MYLILYALILTFILFVILAVGYFSQHPDKLSYPINKLLRLDSCSRNPIIYDYAEIYPVSQVLESQWSSIKLEAKNLMSIVRQDNYLRHFGLDLGDETLDDWNTYPLRLFSADNPRYMELCPVLSSILKSHPEIISCMFSLMKAGKTIEPHVGPYDGLIRYQLALDIPRGECYLHVDNHIYYWTNGVGIVFDETFVHGAVNNTNADRLVLLIDLPRPYISSWAQTLNSLIIHFSSFLPSTKNALNT